MKQITDNRKQKNLLHASRITHHAFGFTIIELLVVMTMTALIATLTLANYRAGEKRRRVSLAGDGIITALTLAQNYSLAGKATNNETSICRIPQYYYLTFTYTNTYTLSAFNNCSTVDTIEIFKLPDNTRVKAAGIALNGGAATSNMLVQFLTPYGKIKAFIDNGGTYNSFSTAVITIESTDAVASKMVLIDGNSGRIEQQ